MFTETVRPQASDTPVKRAIALIGDLHFGSIYSLMHLFHTFDGRTILPSKEQQELNLIFDWCYERIKYWKADTIIFMGDLIQGKNLKDMARSLVTADLEEQRQMCTDYLRPICKGRSVFGVSGTNYHKSLDTEIEQKIIEDLGGTFLQKMAWLTIPNSKRILNVAHESATATIYPFSALEREANQMLKAYGEGKLSHKPDIIIRGHRHLFAHLHTASYHSILVPAFQVWYPFKLSYYGSVQADIGIAMLFIDAKDRTIIHHYARDASKINIGDKTYVLKETQEN